MDAANNSLIKRFQSIGLTSSAISGIEFALQKRDRGDQLNSNEARLLNDAVATLERIEETFEIATQKYTRSS